MATYPRHYQSTALVSAPAEALFPRLDDQTLLSSHMSQSSWMMAGSRMEFVFDQARGQAVGARIGLRGRVLGIPLTVDEVVTERTPPAHKAWETVGSPGLLVIGSYRMGFDIAAAGTDSRLTVFIDYDLPDWPWRWLGWLFGNLYARWCTRTMAEDAKRHFGEARIASSAADADRLH